MYFRTPIVGLLFMTGKCVSRDLIFRSGVPYCCGYLLLAIDYLRRAFYSALLVFVAVFRPFAQRRFINSIVVARGRDRYCAALV